MGDRGSRWRGVVQAVVGVLLVAWGLLAFVAKAFLPSAHLVIVPAMLVGGWALGRGWKHLSAGRAGR